MSTICRDCLIEIKPSRRCPICGGPRVLSHPELETLTIAHMDCDAFFASVEKRDNPALRDKPVIIGGGRRGVVSTACYIARIRGVHSAMPMFKALKLCPEAVVVKPRMAAYVEVSKQIRQMMTELTPAIEPLSMDEAFMDLTGTTKLHGAPPAVMMARLVKRMEDEIGISGSIGLSHNKFLAKLASDLDKPRGFSIIGKAETEAFLNPLPIKKIWGVGKAMQAKLENDGIRKFSDLKRRDRKVLVEQYGTMGDRLWHLCRGTDYRHVSTGIAVKSISKETTFMDDIRDIDLLDGYVWRLSEQVADRAKIKGMMGKVVTLKIKQSNHKSLTRRITLTDPTQMADVIYSHARPLLTSVINKAPFRLIGVGISNLTQVSEIQSMGNLLDPAAGKRAQVERAADKIKEKFGKDAILKGRSLR
ncbi:MAG: DNA polymerase IV [Rhodobacteraceae bacterium]|nr:MAG: DNA polymerase IV [Paracoccaceae bacterium]